MRFEKILIVDDELIIRKSLEEFCHRKRIRVRSVGTREEALEQLKGDHGYDLMFLDINLPDGAGTDILEALEGVENTPLPVMITGKGSIESAVRCMQLGAYDYLLKPFSNEQIEMVLQKAEKLSRLVRLNEGLTNEANSSGRRAIVGESEPIRALKELVRSVAHTDATVLINGETGTGKELIAHAIHNESLRRNKPFIKVNCAAVSETLIESEFFGHEKGAFTGATGSRIGRFELADGGTLLLDEVSEISLPLQAKLLRVLQERELERVGGTKTIPVDVRIIATTNRDLQQSVADGEFREDLYYRLNVFPITSPPLRERGEDITIIAENFLREFSRKHGRKLEGFSREAVRAFAKHTWPGNVRELQNVVERAVILSLKGKLVETRALPLELQLTQTKTDSEPEAEQGEEPVHGVNGNPTDAVGEEPLVPESDKGDYSLASVERKLIYRSLKHCGGNRTQAAKLMEVSVRTLRNKLVQYKEAGYIEFAEFE